MTDNDTVLIALLLVVEVFSDQGHITPACFSDAFGQAAATARHRGQDEVAATLTQLREAVEAMHHPAPRGAWLGRFLPAKGGLKPAV